MNFLDCDEIYFLRTTNIVIGQWQQLKAFLNFILYKKFSLVFLSRQDFPSKPPKSTWHFHIFSPRDEKFSLTSSASERKKFVQIWKHFHSSRLSVVGKSRLDNNRKCKSCGIFVGNYQEKKSEVLKKWFLKEINWNLTKNIS